MCEGVLTCGSELEARDWGQGSSSSLFHIYFLRQDLSQSLEFTGLVRIVANELQASACPSTPPQCWGCRHESQSLGSRDENSSLHMRIASALHLPSPKLWLKQKFKKYIEEFYINLTFYNNTKTTNTELIHKYWLAYLKQWAWIHIKWVVPFFFYVSFIKKWCVW